MGPGGEALTHGVHILEDCGAHNSKCEWKGTDRPHGPSVQRESHLRRQALKGKKYQSLRYFLFQH